MNQEQIQFMLGSLIQEAHTQPAEYSLRQRAKMLTQTLKRTYAIFQGKPGIGSQPTKLDPEDMNQVCELGETYIPIAIFWAAWRLKILKGKPLDEYKDIMNAYYKEIENLIRVNEFIA